MQHPDDLSPRLGVAGTGAYAQRRPSLRSSPGRGRRSARRCADAAVQVGPGARDGAGRAPPRSRREPRPGRLLGAADGRGRRSRERPHPGGEALLGRGARAAEADPDEPLHYVHGWQHHLHLPRHDGRHDGVAPPAGAALFVLHPEAPGVVQRPPAAAKRIEKKCWGKKLEFSAKHFYR